MTRSALPIHGLPSLLTPPFPSVCCRVQSYPQQTALNQHVRTHTKEKPFVCNFDDPADPSKRCRKTFTCKANLKAHNRFHTGEKPYKCKVEGCDAAFAQYTTLKYHEKTKHNTLDAQQLADLKQAKKEEKEQRDLALKEQQLAQQQATNNNLMDRAHAATTTDGAAAPASSSSPSSSSSSSLPPPLSSAAQAAAEAPGAAGHLPPLILQPISRPLEPVAGGVGAAVSPFVPAPGALTAPHVPPGNDGFIPPHLGEPTAVV